MILELTKKNEDIYLYFGGWYRALYSPDLTDFRFIHSGDPIMAADHSCLITPTQSRMPCVKPSAI